MDSIMNIKNQKFVYSIIGDIKKSSTSFDKLNYSWINIGSYAINSQKINSDIDLLFVYEGDGEIERSKKMYKHIEVSVCSVPTSKIIQDGEERYYGGYFSAKCLNPYHIFDFNKTIVDEILTASGKFMGKFAGYIGNQTGKDTFTSEELTSHVFIFFISLHAGYIAYFLDYFVSPEFNNIWDNLTTKITKSLLLSKSIKKVGLNLYQYLDFYKSYETFHFERLITSARHWTYGSYVHNSNYRFQDDYYQNSKNKMTKSDPKGQHLNELRQFFGKISGLDRIIY